MEEQLELPFYNINNWTFLPWQLMSGTWYLRYKDYCSTFGDCHWAARVVVYSTDRYDWESWIDGQLAGGIKLKRGVCTTLDEAKALAEDALRKNKPTHYKKRTKPYQSYQ